MSLSACIICLHVYQIEVLFEISVEFEISIIFEIQIQVFQNWWILGVFKNSSTLQVKFSKALILGGSKILKNLDLNFRHDRNFDLDRNFGQNLTFLHIQKYDASRKRYVSSSFLGRIDIFSGELHFLEGGAKFSIFQSKFEVRKFLPFSKFLHCRIYKSEPVCKIRITFKVQTQLC